MHSEIVLRSKQNYESLLQEKRTRAQDAAPLLECLPSMIQHRLVRDVFWPIQRICLEELLLCHLKLLV